MALASQTARQSAGGRVYSARGGGRAGGRLVRRIAALALLIGVIGAAWFFWPRSPEKAAAAAPETSSSDALAAATDAGDRAANAASPTDLLPDRDGRRAQTESAEREQPPARESGPISAALPEPDPDDLAPLSMIRMGEPVQDEDSPAATDDTARQVQRPTPSGPLPAGAAGVTALMREAEQATAQNDQVAARALLNRAMQDPRASDAQRVEARRRIETINETLVFSPAVIDGDALSERYVVQPGDTLAKIAAREDLNVDWRFIQRINGIGDPRRIRVGQTLKLVRGPFHAVIHKDEYRLDLYAQVGASAEAEQRPDAGLYIASFPVGLGEHDSTPPGEWVVRKESKLINPPWTNPRTGEYYSADNPENPIGERWIGIEGVGDDNQLMSGYGLHGTIDPETIGTDASMGCVRMMPEDVEVVYEMLVEGVSRVRIVE